MSKAQFGLNVIIVEVRIHAPIYATPSQFQRRLVDFHLFVHVLVSLFAR